MKVLIVLPSHNERANIVELIHALLKLDPDYRVCIVDDSSPDGTSELIRQTIAIESKWQKRVHLITRAKKDGRGGAVRDGFLWGLTNYPDIGQSIG